MTHRGAEPPSRRTFVDIAELAVESSNGVDEGAIAAAVDRQLVRAGMPLRWADEDPDREAEVTPSDLRIGDRVARAVVRELP